MVRTVIRVGGIALTVLLAVLVISLVTTFIISSGAASAADGMVGTQDVSNIANTANSMANDTSNFIFNAGGQLPFLGGFFQSAQGLFGSLVNGIASIGQSVGSLFGSIGAQVGNFVGSMGA